jgi:hypothetical protein
MLIDFASRDCSGQAMILKRQLAFALKLILKTYNCHITTNAGPAIDASVDHATS